MSTIAEIKELAKGERFPRTFGTEFGWNTLIVTVAAVAIAAILLACVFASPMAGIGVAAGMIGLGLMGKVSYDSSRKTDILKKATNLLETQEDEAKKATEKAKKETEKTMKKEMDKGLFRRIFNLKAT